MHTAQQVANWFFAWTNDQPDAHITNMKLQKLLYYSQGYSLAQNNSAIFSEKIEAWGKGPVVPSIYTTYAAYKTNTNKLPALSLEVDFDFDSFTSKENELLISIWATYGKYDGDQLSNLTHSEDPWIENYYVENQGHHEISIEELKAYFTLIRSVETIYG